MLSAALEVMGSPSSVAPERADVSELERDMETVEPKDLSVRIALALLVGLVGVLTLACRKRAWPRCLTAS